MLLGQRFAQAVSILNRHCHVNECLVHDHGLWLTTNHAVAKLCRQRKICRIVSPRGMAGTWAMNHGKWKKRFAWRLYQQRDLHSATAFHATSQQEADEIRRLGLSQSIAVIANGISHPQLPSRSRTDNQVRVLFMSRIHPKKGLLNLLQAWHNASLPANWQLILVGPDEGGYQREVERLVASLRLSEQVRFNGSVNDIEKWQIYVDADYFVLPSFNENFGIVIAEALMAGLPVITTTGTPWSGLDEHDCGWWVEPTVSGLQAALQSASKQSTADRQSMGARGHQYVTSEFSWEKSARQMLEFYQFIQRGGSEPTPTFVLR